jgi:hypothetical protein
LSAADGAAVVSLEGGDGLAHHVLLCRRHELNLCLNVAEFAVRVSSRLKDCLDVVVRTMLIACRWRRERGRGSERRVYLPASVERVTEG